MSPATRLAAFAVALLVALGAGAAAGAAFGPVDTGPTPGHADTPAGHGAGTHEPVHDG